MCLMRMFPLGTDDLNEPAAQTQDLVFSQIVFPGDYIPCTVLCKSNPNEIRQNLLFVPLSLEERREDDLPSLNAALDEWQFFSENVSSLVLTMPDRFNHYRVINRF